MTHPAGDYNENVKRIRVAVPHDDDCLRCERILDDAAVPFDLNQQRGTGTVLIYLEDELVQKALDLLEQRASKPISDRRDHLPLEKTKALVACLAGRFKP